MTWNTEKQAVRNVVNTYLKEDAPDLCMRYFESIKCFDSVAQGESSLPDIANAFSDLLMAFPSNKFMREHQAHLSAMAMQGFVSWAGAINGLKNKDMNNLDDQAKMQFYMARRQFHEFACTCSSIQGGDTEKLRTELNKIAIL